jgi:hypothetical protein
VRRWLLGLLFLLACGAPVGPVFHDEDYLRFGLDPRAEADSMIASYRERDEPLSLRIEGHDFTALGFMDRGGLATRARVLTARGIELALDPEIANVLQPSTRYRLLSPPVPGTQDADGDGFEEVFIERSTGPHTCLLVYRVRDVGYVDPIDATFEAFGRSWCSAAVDDVDKDGKAELLVDVSLIGFNERSLSQRVLDWQRSRVRSDIPLLGELAVELAALDHWLGESSEAQLSSFDAAFAGVSLSAGQRARVQRARQRIERDWNPPRPAAETSSSGAAAPDNVTAPPARPTQAELVHKRGS